MVSIGLIHRLPPRKNANNTSAAVRMRSLPLSEINLRARSTADNRQIGQMTTKERGLKASHDVLICTLSPEDSRSKWQVNSDCLRYYRKLLQRQGLEQQPLQAAARARGMASQCTCSNPERIAHAPARSPQLQ